MKRLPMRKIREALRLRADGLSGRQMALSLSLGRATVSDYLRARCGWPVVAFARSERWSACCFPARLAMYVLSTGPICMAAEGRDAFAALSIPRYGYSRFCARWEGKPSPVMRQRHPAGERLFVDYAGATMDVVCPHRLRTAQLFVAMLYHRAEWTHLS